MTKSSIETLGRRWRTFSASRQGNVSITFALSILPMMALIGAAIDYGHGNSVKSAMQSALDATALAYARAAYSMTPSDLSAQTTNYFNGLLTRPELKNIQVTSSYDTAKSKLVLDATATLPTSFVNIVGVSNLPIGVSSTAAWGTTRLRVALVLDNTGSMASAGKIGALKTATNNLLTQLKGAAFNNGDVYVSIVPFAKDVNLGSASFNANWLDWTDWNAANGTCSKGNKTNQGACLAQTNAVWTPDKHSKWTGCVTDRGDSSGPNKSNYDTNVVAPDPTISATLFSPEQYAECPQEAMGLNYDWSQMKNVVNNMSPGGNTNQAIGLATGWMSLVGGGPFTAPAMDPKYKYSQIIILLTDGLNTQDRWYYNQSSIDARQKITCDNINAAGVTLYTIQVNTSGDPTSSLLRNCATDPSKFFLLKSANEIVSTFQQIGTNISQLRVAQ